MCFECGVCTYVSANGLVLCEFFRLLLPIGAATAGQWARERAAARNDASRVAKDISDSDDFVNFSSKSVNQFGSEKRHTYSLHSRL